jgi:hypothetical protein
VRSELGSERFVVPPDQRLPGLIPMASIGFVDFTMFGECWRRP